MSWLLTLQDDNGDFELVGNAFQIDPDYLKKVQTSNGVSFILFWNSFEMGNDKD
ncbi:unnamed protein product [Durusdinium trenchii]|uniref:Uncharacterized protein n=1 Tax=Durusdinium trenchii TaxID=1381693 RepID=A0ABP0QJC3_9DINO